MRNIVVTGFMGTGKTAVAQEIAHQLGRPFVDMDAEIEARAGKSIPRIFEEDGEAAFRQMEAALCKELSAQKGLVIATGGGALIDPVNREMMMKSGTIICLTCGVDEIIRRLKGKGISDRPLLDENNLRPEIERLLEARREVYRSFPWQIDTTGLSIAEVAAQAIEIGEVITLPVRYPGGRYEIHIGNGTLKHVGYLLRATGANPGSHVAIVSNPVVAPLYAPQINEALRSAGFQPFECLIPDGEAHKTLVTVETLYEQFLAGGLDRTGTVLALGGGVTGDVAGFAAATFMRGVRFVQVPTTLLSMVDASVGGKTGVDLPAGKNLVGAFKQPSLVVIDPTVLATLPTAEIRSGLAETIKHGIIGAPDLFAELEAGTNHSLFPPSRIARALQVKIAIVEEDPFEQGHRAILNLGHTVGHALEKLSNFKLSHGEAVSIGIVAATRIAAKLSWADSGLVERVEAALSACGLPVRCPPFRADAIWEAMAYDKKREGQSLRLVLPRAIGEVEITKDVPPLIIKSVLCDMKARC